ncbi:hypothetical protein IEO70_12230 [Bacillus sp. AGMB 02131]|uniref:Uncharacterized protein n=1 Tax=Peribacillus faecalis TaxID=2772559 RepID=A0A927HAW1_9BACI|nr:hypothetical protein [Peribacillus faecalis]MBD3109115.1 hypothetical protein [Peribacillus faecalis]
MTAFEHTDNSGNKDHFATEELEHRLYYEFKEFTRIIDEVDFVFANDEQYVVV